MVVPLSMENNELTIWVDADACPKPIKEILYRLADRIKKPLVLVANHSLSTPNSLFIRSIQVASGFDVADDYISQHISKNDIIITQDIPLAAELLSLGAHVLNTRGERLTKNNIGARLNMRDFMETMRSSGEHTGGPAPFSQADRQKFANTLDRLIAQLL